MKKIIDFFKQLFCIGRTRESIVESEDSIDSIESINLTRGIHSAYNLKVLINNCIDGYDIINAELFSGDIKCNIGTIIDHGSVCKQFSTYETPHKYLIKCGIKCNDGELINNLYYEVPYQGPIMTINITPTSLNLHKIDFDVEIENNEESHAS